MIDITVPFFGDADLLRVAVESVLSQRCPDWRLTVVDDAYPDPAAAEWISDIADERVHLVRNQRTLGVRANFQRCLELGAANRIVIMGCDDVMRPNYVGDVLRAHRRFPDVAMLQPRVNVIDEHGRDTRTLTDTVKSLLASRKGETPLGGEQLARSLMWGNWLYFPAIAWRRADIASRPFRADMETVMDLDLLMRLILADGQLVLLGQVAFDYRRHSASVSSRTAVDAARFREESRLYSELVPRLEAQGWHRAARAARMHPTSRMHALSLLPRALLGRRRSAVSELLKQSFG